MIIELTFLDAAAWGVIASLGLFAGALVAVHSRLKHRGIARLMATSAGFLFAVASLELVVKSIDRSGPVLAALALAAGAAAYSGANAWIGQRARDRKRCGECVAQPTEAAAPGSGLAIAIGTMLDGIPEGIVLGLETARGGTPGVAVIFGLVVGNFAEAISSTSGLVAAGRSLRYILILWSGAALLIPVAAAISGPVFSQAPPMIEGALSAFAAGALISMIIETVIPEAAHGSIPLSGLIATTGFAVLVLVLWLSTSPLPTRAAEVPTVSHFAIGRPR
jgi:ZIP family zinc transporter